MKFRLRFQYLEAVELVHNLISYLDYSQLIFIE